MDRVPRRHFLIAIGALLAPALSARAQQPAKIARIGFMGGDLAGNPRATDSFLQGLRALGYEQGRNIVIEFRDAERKFERFPALAAELVALKVDVIVAPSVLGALGAKQATSTIPILFAGVIDPVTDGLVNSLARPGGNVTGLSNLAPELAGKRMELLKEAVPSVSRVAMLWQPSAAGAGTNKEMLRGTEVAARALGFRLQVVEARDPADLDRAFADMVGERAGALALVGSPMFFYSRQHIAELAAKHRLPAIYMGREYVDAGGLMSYGANLADLIRRTATYVDKILKGAKAADLPVEQPTKFELIVNLKTAKTLGLTLPPSLLARTDEMIQ